MESKEKVGPVFDGGYCGDISEKERQAYNNGVLAGHYDPEATLLSKKPEVPRNLQIKNTKLKIKRDLEKIVDGHEDTLALSPTARDAIIIEYLVNVLAITQNSLEYQQEIYDKMISSIGGE